MKSFTTDYLITCAVLALAIIVGALIVYGAITIAGKIRLRYLLKSHADKRATLMYQWASRAFEHYEEIEPAPYVPREVDAEEFLVASCQLLLDAARQAGYDLRIEKEALTPLAMGNAKTVITFTPRNEIYRKKREDVKKVFRLW